MDEEKFRRLQSYTKKCRQLVYAENGRNSIPQGKAHQLIVQCQKVSPKNIHTDNIIHTEQVILEINIHMHMCVKSNLKSHVYEREQGEVYARVWINSLLR